VREQARPDWQIDGRVKADDPLPLILAA
jgi:hypothetical protein